MTRVLVVSPTYLPGFKGGGPIQSLSSMIEWLGDDLEFRVITADRDLGANKSYDNVQPGRWHTMGKSQVLYLPPERLNLVALWRLLKNHNHDLLYLNSFLSPLCVKVLLLRRANVALRTPIIVSPRGCFQPCALQIKRQKKLLFLRSARALRLYDDVFWQVSTRAEKADVLASVVVNPSRVFVTGYLLSRSFARDSANGIPKKEVGAVRVIFLSRISAMKNLDFAITILGQVKGKVDFDIYGPLEDLSLWARCRKLIQRLPATVRVRYCGAIEPGCVPETLAKYHLFILPTRGENFGYAILEALGAGCLALISDQTPWLDLDEEGIGWALPLSQPEAFSQAVSEVVMMDQSTFRRKSKKSVSYVRTLVMDSEAVGAHRHLFHMASRA